MTREDVKSLLIQTKIFYPRFDSVEKVDGGYRVNAELIEGWYRQIGWMDVERAMQILNEWMMSDEGRKTPQITLWIRGGKRTKAAAECTMRFDRKNGLVIWKPDGSDRSYEIPVEFNIQNGCWEDARGYLYVIHGEE